MRKEDKTKQGVRGKVKGQKYFRKYTSAIFLAESPMP
jgi:hypothetical protein